MSISAPQSRAPVRVLLVAVAGALRTALVSELEKQIGEWPHVLTDCGSWADLEKIKDEFQFLIAGPEIVRERGAQLTMVLQALRAPTSRTGACLFAVSDKADGFDRTAIVDRGFHDAYVFAADAARFATSVQEQLFVIERNSYASVKLTDIEAESCLDFQISIFLPRIISLLLTRALATG